MPSVAHSVTTTPGLLSCFFSSLLLFCFALSILGSNKQTSERFRTLIFKHHSVQSQESLTAGLFALDTCGAENDFLRSKNVEKKLLLDVKCADYDPMTNGVPNVSLSKSGLLRSELFTAHALPPFFAAAFFPMVGKRPGKLRRWRDLRYVKSLWSMVYGRNQS